MTYQRESVSDVMGELGPLIEMNAREKDHLRGIKLDPDYALYQKADAAGFLRVFTARVEGELVGYLTFMLGNPHYKSTLTATQDLLFMVPEHRGLAGARFIRYGDRQLKQEGVKAIFYHRVVRRH